MESRYRHTSFDRILTTLQVLKSAVGDVYGVSVDSQWPDVTTYVDSLKVLANATTRNERGWAAAEEASSEFSDAQLKDFFRNLDLSSAYSLVRGAVAIVIYLNGLPAQVIRTLTHAGSTQSLECTRSSHC